MRNQGNQSSYISLSGEPRDLQSFLLKKCTDQHTHMMKLTKTGKDLSERIQGNSLQHSNKGNSAYSQ